MERVKNKLNTDMLSIDQVKRLTVHAFIGISTTVVNSIILALFLWSVIPKNRIIIWLFCALAISFIRLIFQIYSKKREITVENVAFRRNFILFSLFIAGCVWGSAGVFLFPKSSFLHQVLITFVLGGMVAGSVGVFAALMPAFYSFSIPTVIPIIIVFFSSNVDIHFAMGTMTTFFWLIMVMTARSLNRVITEFLNLKYENFDLISNLEKEIKERKSAEQKLLTRNQEIEAIVQDRTEELRELNKKLVSQIEDRKEAVKALRESEEKYRELSNSLPQIVFETDEMGNITFANRNAFKLFGYNENDFQKGINLFRVIIPEDMGKAHENVQAILDGIESDKNEYLARRKDGSTFPIAVHSNPVMGKNISAGIRGIIIDLTEQKRVEEEQKKLEAHLQRAEKMEALGTMAGGVAHDLNNILSGIVSYPDLLLMEIPKDSPLKKPILTMQESGKKAAAIVQDLLTLTRRGVITEEVVNINHIISEYMESPEYRKLMSFHQGIQVELALEEDLLNIQGSPVHLNKTIMNLVSNASEALQDGGDIIISTKNRYLDRPVRGYDEIEKGDYVILSVADNGIGISPDDIERIFEPFFTKKVMGRSGTGLGMAVVWGTVKDHKGYIDVESGKGKGTTFSLYFPVTRRALSKTQNLEPIDSVMGKGESILLVDDAKEQQEIASAILSQIGYSVTAVSSGEEAVAYMEKNTVDLLVLDMIMDPGIDGLDTYKRIIKKHPGQKAIIASGFSETERVKEAQRLGAGTYIRKPYTLIKLGQTVRKELDR